MVAATRILFAYGDRGVDIAREAERRRVFGIAIRHIMAVLRKQRGRSASASKLNILGPLLCARDSVQHPFAVLVCLDRLPREGQMRIAFDDSGPLRYDGEARKKRRQSYAA